MAKKRVHEIAKSQGMTSKEVLAKLQAAGLEVKAAASSVEESDALKALGGGNGAAPAEAPAPAAAKPDGAPAPAATQPRPAAPAKPAAAPPPAAQNEPPAAKAPEAKQPPRPGPGAGPRVVQPPTPPGDRPAPGTGPRIISGPEPAERPKRDESANQPGGAGRRPSRGGMQGERAPGGGAGGRRRVVIDSQASRRPGGPGGGPGGPGGPPGPQQRGPRRRGRRRREVLAEVAPELDLKAQQRTDVVRINSGSTVKDVAEYLGVPTPEIIKKLMGLGEMATLTQTLSDDAIHVLAEEFDKEVEIVHVGDDIEAEPAFADDEADLTDRPPVVTIMGHVDHGKTSLLDAIRQTEVVAGEAGGITQHIGAYQVSKNDHTITFIDTPGHQAFTAMRARGAKVTDIAVIVVAADDGVMPQTVEAIDHAKAAAVPIMVAVNKIDKEGADPNRVRGELAQQGLTPADWGGDTEFVDVSAKTHDGLDDLLETIVTLAEIQELKANPDTPASGTVVESELDPGRGPVATVLVQRGTLKVGDALVAGAAWAKVRSMQDFRGQRVDAAPPGMPVEVLGFDSVPDAGEIVRVVENERKARTLAAEREDRLKREALARRTGVRVLLEDLWVRAEDDPTKTNLPLIVKADVAGSLEALEDEIAKLPQSEITVEVIHDGVGGINESDVMLAAASDAVIIGFNVRPVGSATDVSNREGVEIRTYSVIYQIIDELRAAMQGLLEPEEVERTVATVEVRDTFRASRIGVIAGSYVVDGTVTRNAQARLVRDGTVVYDGRISTLRRFKDDVREVQAGFECGITLENYMDVKEGDVIEVYEKAQVERTLES